MRLAANTFLLMAALASGAPAAHATTDSLAFSSPDALRHYAQGRLLEEQGRAREAMGEFYRALALDPRAVGVARRASEVAARVGEHARSLEFAERTLRLAPDDTRARWLRGAALFNLDRPGEALDDLIAAARADSVNVEYLHTLGRVAEHLDRLEWVRWAYARAVEAEPFDGEFWFQFAAAEARGGRFGVADSALARAEQLNPMRPGLQFMRGWVHESLGRPSAAIESYREHLAAHPSDLPARMRLMNALAAVERWRDAWEEARQIAAERPADPEALEAEAHLAFRAKREREGRDALRRLEELDRDAPETLARAVTVLERNGRAAEARRAVTRWQTRHPGDFRGPLLAGRLLVQRGEPKRGTAWIRRAVAVAPDSLAPRIVLGQLLQGQDRFAEAEAEWRAIVEREPGFMPARFNLAFCREQRGDVAGAEAAVRDILAREPENPDALNFLGYLWADHNMNLEEAEHLIERAVAHEPDNGAFVDSLGWVYYRLGRLAEARLQLERAIELTGGDPVVHEHLGDVYNDMELKELAKEQYRMSLAADSSSARVRAKLEALR